MTVRGLTVAGIAATLCAALSAPAAGATPPDGDATRTDLAKGVTETPVSITTDGPTTLIVQSLALQPGASSGWHTHPGSELSVITGGAVALQTATACGPVTYGAGQAVFIPAGVPHRVANQSGSEAQVVLTYTLPVDAPVRGDAPDACAK
ncbi:quercetin dioxygenase-like cupin family protein [Mycolicibacterium sp. BK556]|uniref:cupin domain-containing protein n=1 Tax=unclassified Mycolicibacterium TaxID=2636767 RepID=UPI00161E8237|nr:MULTISPECIES: cupin domain-containing protein [unclassified Mycolicibacterium]MBB3605562.1 quercetin dioxygenase-like cupin family protein [Mycolicibacterium sp. BK556]MBB3635941.1 quercetin dioxygenase-like cupin family protein [Mycolicibacterium sp. BK607]MBB3753354.1 quercetin dioxygenase-like cupin family protein [Mycolicibacterium sp. BK634]